MSRQISNQDHQENLCKIPRSVSSIATSTKGLSNNVTYRDTQYEDTGYVEFYNYLNFKHILFFYQILRIQASLLHN